MTHRDSTHCRAEIHCGPALARSPAMSRSAAPADYRTNLPYCTPGQRTRAPGAATPCEARSFSGLLPVCCLPIAPSYPKDSCQCIDPSRALTSYLCDTSRSWRSPETTCPRDDHGRLPPDFRIRGRNPLCECGRPGRSIVEGMMRNSCTLYAPVVALALITAACAPPMRSMPVATRVIVVSDDEDRSQLKVPPGHLPRAGQCRVWFPGRPPGQQPSAGSCNGIERVAPAGSWILYRPTHDKRVVHAR